MSGIKNKLKILVSLMMIFAVIITSVPSMADETLDFTGTFQVFAGQDHIIGTAIVEIDNGMLTVHVNMDPDWPADAYSLYIMEEEPTDRLTPGHAPYKNEDLDNATNFTIGPIDLDLPELSPGQCLTRYLVLHLVSGTETAYPGDIINPDSGPWYGFIPVEICEPITTPTGSLTLRKIIVDSEGNCPEDDDTLFTIFVIDQNNTKLAVEVNGNGPAIELKNLALGSYTISETPPENYTLQSIVSGEKTSTNDLKITISEDDLDHHVIVTNRKDAKDDPKTWSLILTKKVVDTDNNPVITNATFEIEITYPDGTIHTQSLKGDGTTVTLDDLSSGIYTVSEDAPEGYTLKSIQTGETITDNALEIIISEHGPAQIVEVTVTNERQPEPDPPQDPDPPSRPPEKRGEIRVHKYLDTNQNNLQDPTEFDMQHITFELYAADKTTLLHTKKTDTAGNLSFSNLTYGTYYLREVSDYTITSPSFAADGFSTTPIEINSTQVLTFNVGNYRDTTTEDVPPSPPPPEGAPPDEPPKGPPNEPPEIEIVEDDPPLGAPPWEPPNTLPPTGEVPAAMLNLLGTLLLIAGAFLKYQY